MPSYARYNGPEIIYRPDDVSEDEIQRFNEARGFSSPNGAQQPRDLKAGQFFKDGEYAVVAGNAGEAGWGDYVLPGYSKIGYTDDKLILKRSSQQQAAAAPPPTAPAPAQSDKPYTPSADVLAARDRVNAWRQSSSSDSNVSGLKIGESFLGNLNAISNYGARLNDDYQRRFIPALEDRARLAALEIGGGTRDQVSRLDPGIKLPKVRDIYGASGGIDPTSLFSQMQNLVRNA